MEESKSIKHPYVGTLAGRFHNQLIEIDRILAFSLNGIKGQASAPQAVGAIAGYEAYKGQALPKEEHERRLQDAKDRAKFASAQIEAGFPVLYSHAVVAIWSAIETFIEDLVVYGLLEDKSYLQKEVFRKIRILFVEYDVLDPEDRMRYMVSELGRQTNAELKQGIKRFEPLLEAVDLGGAIPEDMRRTCYELWAIRNLIVHRSGIVDRRIKQLCPWLHVEVGKLHLVTPASYRSYFSFAGELMIEILVRDMVRCGAEREFAVAYLKSEHKPDHSNSPTAEKT